MSASSAESAKEDASASVSDGFHALLDGVSTGIDALASLVMFLSFTALSLVFLLKDGPAIRAWGERHLGVPPRVTHTITERVITSLRGYFAGVSVVGAWTAGIFTVLITLGAEGPETAALMALIVLLANGISSRSSSRSPTGPRWVSTHSRS